MIIHFVYFCFFPVHLFFLGWSFVTYGIDLVSIPRHYILVSYWSQNDGIEPSLLSILFVFVVHTQIENIFLWKKVTLFFFFFYRVLLFNTVSIYFTL